MKWVKVFDSKEQAFEALQEKVPRLLQIGERKLCITRFEDKIFITDNKCPHNGDSLSKGAVNHLGEIICPWHNYRYALSSGKECSDRSNDLKTYSVKLDLEGLFVALPN